MTAILQDASGKMHHGILFDRPVWVASKACFQALPPFPLPRPPLGSLRSPLFLQLVNQKPNKQTSHE